MDKPVHMIRTALYPDHAMRLHVNPRPGDPFPHSDPLLADDQTIEIKVPSTDVQGFLRSVYDDLLFLYDPLTGNLKIKKGQSEVCSGVLQLDYDASPHLMIRLKPGDIVHGFGSGILDSREGLIELKLIAGEGENYQVGSFPFFMLGRQDKSIAVFLNCPYPLNVVIDHNGLMDTGPGIFLTPDPGKEFYAMDAFFFHGTPQEILQSYSRIVGTSFFPPFWALGSHYRGAFKHQDSIPEFAASLRKTDPGAMSIHLGPEAVDHRRVFTWRPGRYDHPVALGKNLSNLGFHLVAESDTAIFIEDGYKIYEQSIDRNFFCRNAEGLPYRGNGPAGASIFCDYTNPDAAKWWGDSMQELFKANVRGSLIAGSEPDLHLPAKKYSHGEEIEHFAGSHLCWRNLYANLRARSEYEGFRRNQSDVRPFILSPTGFPGLQRYAGQRIICSDFSWKSLKHSLRTVRQLALNGVSYSGIEIKADHSAKGLRRMLSRNDLNLRWLEATSLLPYFRAGDILSRPEREDSLNTELMKKHLRRRARLLPYMYALMKEAALNGSPPIRPLFFDYPDLDMEQYDQFMLGPHILIAPVLSENARFRDVRIPPGVWYEYETGKVTQGNCIIKVPLQAGYYPIYVRAGAILPTLIGDFSDSAEPDFSIVKSMKNLACLEIYPGETMHGTYYTDALDGMNYGDEYFQLQITGTRERNGNIDLQFRGEGNMNQFAPASFTLRLPENYRCMKIGNTKIQANSESLIREDRVFSMNSFALDSSLASAHFPFKAGREI